MLRKQAIKTPTHAQKSIDNAPQRRFVSYHRHLIFSSWNVYPHANASDATSWATSNNVRLGPNYWIFLPGLDVAVGTFLLSFGSERQPLLLLWVSAALVPTLGGVTLKSIGQHFAASVCAVVVLACYWTPVFLLLFTLIAKPALGFVMAVYGGFIAIPITTLALAATASFSKTMGRRWAGAAVIAGTLPAIAVAVSAILHGAKYTN